MKITEIHKLLCSNIVTGEELMHNEVDYGYGCDLMSDVLAFVKNNVLLLTGLIHPQVIRTADMLDIKAIVIVRGKKPSNEFIQMAKNSEIIVLTTKHSLFTACGILHKHGLAGEEIGHNESPLSS